MHISEKLNTRSAIFLTLTSMVGAGIFIKTQTLNMLAHNKIGPILLLFFLFFISMLCLSYVLFKIIPSQTGNMGFIEWSNIFCNPGLHASFCNFIRYFYYPSSLFLFSVYGVLGISGEKLGISSTLLLSFVVVLFFIFINFLSFKWSKRIQVFLSFCVVIPLFLLPFLAIINPGGSEIIDQTKDSYWSSSSYKPIATGLDSIGPWMMLLSGLPSLLFIYDGFYNIASLKSKFRDPKKLRFVILVSILLVTLIYLNVIISFNLGDPKEANFRNFRVLSGKSIINDLFDILISCASLLTLNSITMGCMSQLTAMNEKHKFSDIRRFRKFIFYKRGYSDGELETKITISTALILRTFFCFLITGLVIYIMTKYELSNNPKEVIHALADVVTIVIFVILLAIIHGSYRRKSNIFRNDQLFRVCAVISGLTILIALGYLLISYLAGITGYGGSNVFSSVIKLIMFLVFIVGCAYWKITFLISKRFQRKKFILYPIYHKDSMIKAK